MVRGQTNTGENIKCRIQVLTGNHTQNGSFIINKGAETKNPKIPKW